jgi:hypothetical protein
MLRLIGRRLLLMVPFFITQLRTQKKTVFGIQGPGNFYCIMSEAFKTA